MTTHEPPSPSSKALAAAKDYVRANGIPDSERKLAAFIDAFRPAPVGEVEAVALPNSEEIQAWIALEYREPEAQVQLDNPRFTRWNMEVAFAGGFRAAIAAMGGEVGRLDKLREALERIVAKDPKWQKDERIARSMAGIARQALGDDP